LPVTYIAVGCSNSSVSYIAYTEVKNDTAELQKLAIKTAFHHYNLPDIDAVMMSYRFKDSVLFTANNPSLNFLPKHFGNIPFKNLPKSKSAPY